jgi:hypothetical protein
MKMSYKRYVTFDIERLVHDKYFSYQFSSECPMNTKAQDLAGFLINMQDKWETS